MKLLEVKNLNVFYGPCQALQNISFHVNQGEVVSLIGANGAGKTSTLRAISGLVPSQGDIVLAGKSIQHLPAHLRVKEGISQSPEGRGVFSNLTVYENLLMGAFTVKSKQQIHEEIEKSFARFPRLKERAYQLAGTLSGGEQQMLSICRALMIRPQILLLDEPSLGLAPKIVLQIFELIAELNKSGVTVLLVEQNARLALKASHRAYVLETGTIGLEGRGQDLLKDDQVRQKYLGV